MKKLPILLSIPHGGTKKPPEILDHLCITDHDEFDDSDPFVIEIYDLKDKVQRVIKSDIARAYVDLNRSLQDLPPKNPDGLIKSMTCYQKPIYKKGREPDEKITKLLIEKYYKPYHRDIQKSISELDLQLCLDCHSMATEAPSISPDGKKSKRPAFCISNQDGKTCSKEMITHLGKSLCDVFMLGSDDIKFNDPFKGGHITKTYGNNPIPWIQIEMNRNLYLSEQWFNRDTLTADTKRLSELNKLFEKTLTDFFEKI